MKILEKYNQKEYRDIVFISPKLEGYQHCRHAEVKCHSEQERRV